MSHIILFALANLFQEFTRQLLRERKEAYSITPEATGLPAAQSRRCDFIEQGQDVCYYPAPSNNPEASRYRNRAEIPDRHRDVDNAGWIVRTA